MTDRLQIWLGSKQWYWRLRTRVKKIGFLLERSAYKIGNSATKAKTNAGILGSITWVGIKSLTWVVISLAVLFSVENYVRTNHPTWIQPLSLNEKTFIIEQLRLYAQLLTTIFSIYFATIGIILSAGYTELRRDIIQMLTNEQVGSFYSRVLVLAAIFCLASTTLTMFGFEPDLLVYGFGTILTVLSALALFPLGQRLFNFFDLNLLVRSEILPTIAHHIAGASSPNNSESLANHHSKMARQALEQLSYIDDRVTSDREELEDNLSALTDDYTTLVLHYLEQKHTINKESYWFPRRRTHKQWFLAGDTSTTTALHTSSQQMLIEDKPDHQWFESEITNRLAKHIELAFQVGDLNLALKLLGRLRTRISSYANRFQFDVGLQELKRFKNIIEHSFSLPVDGVNVNNVILKIGIADAWAALASNLCLETQRRMMIFESELQQFFEVDEWNEKSLRRLPVFLQVELYHIVERIEFELEVDGQRLSKQKYVQQLAVQKLLQKYERVLPEVCDIFQNVIPDFVEKLEKLEMPEAATQVALASLHSHWKLPGRFDEIAQLLNRYQNYEHYKDKVYALPVINIEEMSKQIQSAREGAITMLGNEAMVKHIFQQEHNDEIPDHFGQIYFELAEACISALERNDKN